MNPDLARALKFYKQRRDILLAHAATGVPSTNTLEEFRLAAVLLAEQVKR